MFLTVSGSAAADVLSEANQLLAKGSYGEAFPVFQMLANTGNPEAKLRLGQMYWYGKGLPADRAKADKLFAEAAAAGNAEAKDALSLSSRREAHAAEIGKWAAYDGADLTSGKYACAEPAIGELSKTNAEIKATTEGYKAWSACYNGFVADLQGPLAPAKRIPADLFALMSEAEQDDAMAHIAKSTGAAASKAGASAKTVIARYDSWEKATAAYAKEHNDKVAASQKASKQQIETEQRIYGEQKGLYSILPASMRK
ncbi:hypothetical protein GCM10027321_20350 [Massilia terrae]